ncbi:MAG: insulinase family protein [Saprospiraceae bacterium]|nr:insulinase family protein [Saprospiraceae bacterium]
MKTALTNRRPIIRGITEVNFPTTNTVILDNGIPLHILEGGNQSIVKMEIAVLAGRPREAKQLVAASYGSLLKEGSAQYSSLEIAETFDRFGATFSQPFSFDYVSLQVYVLTKHCPKILPVFCSMIKDPVFPESELILFKERVKQKLSVDLTQNEIVAYREATELFFGAKHPYGYNSNAQLYDAVTQYDLLEHHQNVVGPQNTKMLIAGKLPDDTIDQLQEHLGQWNKSIRKRSPALPQEYPIPTRMYHDLEKSQSAIRIGRRLFDNSHEDYPAMLLLTTILGGYFGSRLMKNLREDKGYTYGVHASVEDLKYDGYFTINLETDRQHCKKVIQEIDHEIDVLQSIPVPADELTMVKNYISGHLLSKMDGPIQAMTVIKKNILYANDPQHMNVLIKKLQKVDVNQIMDVARKYLDRDLLTEVVIH